MPHPEIVVLAGVNGAGKSSVAGAILSRAGGTHFDPDAFARELEAAGVAPGVSIGLAWSAGRDGLLKTIQARESFAIETTLGGNTITVLLRQAAASGLPVRALYVGLDSVDRHLARVRARVARGGHDIPEARIRVRWRRSRENLVTLMPDLHELVLWDNSIEHDPTTAFPPSPLRVMRVKEGRILELLPLVDVPSWARPIVEAALAHDQAFRPRA